MGKILPPTQRALAPQNPPIGVFRQYCLQQPTTLVLKEKVLSLSGDGFEIKDMNGQVVIKCKGNAFSLHDRTDWAAPDGTPLFTMARKLLHKKYTAEGPDGNDLFSIANKFALGSKMVATFKNVFDGRDIELKLRGDVFGKSAEICMGEVPIAFISRQVANMRNFLTDQDTYFVTIAPGVDIGILAAFCVVFDCVENEM